MEDFTVVALRHDVILPEKTHNNDAGFDLFSPDEHTIAPGEWIKIPLGIALELSPSTVGLVMEKSGLANQYALISLARVIDASYRGEIHAVMMNLGSIPVMIKANTKVAQLLVMEVYSRKKYDISIDVSYNTSRGTDGFGSTGVKPKDPLNL